MRKPLTILIDNPREWVGKLVHVSGWNKACVFRLHETDGSTHRLVTPKTGRVFMTKNQLLMTRRDQERLEAESAA